METKKLHSILREEGAMPESKQLNCGLLQHRSLSGVLAPRAKRSTPQRPRFITEAVLDPDHILED